MPRVDLLGVLFMIWGALTMLIGASTLALGIAAAAIVASAGRAGTGQFGASLTAVTFMTLAVLALIWGGVHLMVGTLVRRRRHWSRHRGFHPCLRPVRLPATSHRRECCQKF